MVCSSLQGVDSCRGRAANISPVYKLQKRHHLGAITKGTMTRPSHPSHTEHLRNSSRHPPTEKRRVGKGVENDDGLGVPHSVYASIYHLQALAYDS